MKQILLKQVGFTIHSLLDNESGSGNTSIKPHTVTRTSDGQVFALGDRVTNGTQMIGNIKEFNILEGSLYVLTTWSGIGMNLDSLIKADKLPSRFQPGDKVSIRFKNLSVPVAYITKVIFSNNKICYDIAIQLDLSTNKNESSITRLHNVDGLLLEDPIESVP